MWILNILPDWLFYAIFFIGVIGFAVTYLLKWIPIPAIYMYKTPIQIVSTALIALGTFMSGAVWNQNAWLEKVHKLEKQVAEAEAKSEKVNTEVVVKYVTKTQVIKEKGEDVVKYIDREVVKIDEQCRLSQEAVKAHNDAVKERK
jgi:hypothetical protein